MQVYWVIAAMCCIAWAAEAACPIDRATYRPVMRDEFGDGTEYHAVFTRQRHHMANEAPYLLTMREKKSGLSYTFYFAQPNGYGQTLILIKKPEKLDGEDADDKPAAKADDPDADISGSALFFDKAMRSVEPLYEKAGEAPPYMLFADLGKSFWYSHLSQRRFVPPRGMWQRVACGA